MNASRKMIAGGLAAVGGMVVGAGLILGAGLAKADTSPTYGSEGDHNAYLLAAEISYHRHTVSAANAAEIARHVCYQHSLGFTRNELLRHAYLSMPSGAAIDSIFGAEFHFCPQYDVVNQGDDGGPADPSEGFDL